MPPGERSERLAKAEAAIKKVVELEPRSATAHAVHGTVLRARSGRGDSEQAVKAFEAAIALDENIAVAHAELGRTLIDVGQPRDALRHLQKAIDLSPHDISAFIWKYWSGLAALHVPDPKAAVDWLRQSLQDNPVHDNTLRLMAVALADDRQEEAALQKAAEFMKARRNATAGDWAFPGWGAYPEVERMRKHIRATLIRLGVPEVSKQAASTP
jgi:tetratricopeptide (TPR) repeat protein